MNSEPKNPQFNVAAKAVVVFALAVVCFFCGRVTSGQLKTPPELGWVMPIIFTIAAILIVTHDWKD